MGHGVDQQEEGVVTMCWLGQHVGCAGARKPTIEARAFCSPTDTERVHCARLCASFAEALLFVWSAGPQVEVMTSTLRAPWRKGVFMFISHISEPLGSRLGKEPTQGRLKLLYSPEYNKQNMVTVLKSRAGLGQVMTVCVGLTFLSESAASDLEKASYDCKNFILFNNNNSTKIIQSTFNT